MFFFLSKTAWLLIQPIGLLMVCTAAVTIATLAKRLPAARVFSILGLLLLIVCTQTNAGRLLLQPLENRFARPEAVPPADAVAGIIVLGGGFDGHVTLARGGFELGESGDRFVEALRLARALPEVPLVVSGGEASLIGATEGDAPIAARFFTEFGIAPERIVLENQSLNTHENAVYSSAVISDLPKGRWLLVTSAFHMPRAVGAFRNQDVDVIPWPVDFRTNGVEKFAVGRDDPLAAFSETNLGMREWTGLVVYAATGRITEYFPR